MLTMHYEGWFQCRLATDPDPTDELIGVAGPTFIVAGEPYLDRVIRLQDPVAPRYPFEEKVGVNVTHVSLHDEAQANHPLIGGRLEFLEEAKFWSLNFIIAESWRTPIDPFHIKLSHNDIVLQRKDMWDIAQPDLTIMDVTPEQLARRQPGKVEFTSVAVAEATGIVNYKAFRAERLRVLQKRYNEVQDKIEKEGLERRIIQLQDDNIADIAFAAIDFLGTREIYTIDINGPATVIDKDNALKGKVGTAQDWKIHFWFGGYDVDTMCGYMKGYLSVPFYAEA